MDYALLAGQTALVWILTLWLALGALENVRNPGVNLRMVSEVMSMARMAETYPDYYAVFSRNRVENARAHLWTFRAIVAAEVVVALAMLWGAVMMTLALADLAPAEAARGTAALGVAGFATIWGAFLVGGQWFHYWCGYEGSQATHFYLAIWGAVALVVLAL